MDFYRNLRVQEEHNKDLLRQAEQYRLVQRALEGRPHRTSLPVRMLNWLGLLITNLICFIQRQFGGRAQNSTVSSYQNPCSESA